MEMESRGPKDTVQGIQDSCLNLLQGSQAYVLLRKQKIHW